MHKHLKLSCTDPDQTYNSATTPTFEFSLVMKSTAIAEAIRSEYTFKC